MIQARRTLYDGSSGGVETLASLYDFTGRATRTEIVQTFNSVTSTVNEYFTYDQVGRLTKVEQEISGGQQGNNSRECLQRDRSACDQKAA